MTGVVERFGLSDKWDNPFVIRRDGHCDEGCEDYETEHWPNRPDLKAKVHSLRGKALGGHCGAKRYHGDFLKRKAEE